VNILQGLRAVALASGFKRVEFIGDTKLSPTIIRCHHHHRVAHEKIGHPISDLAKAFDRLEWNFIAAALARKGLHEHFINLVHVCVSSPSFSVIINGQAFESFISSRGIRQGCPLSPYLFILAINELSILLGEALSANQLTGISLGPNCPPIHSLLFADDLLICGNASLLKAQSMKRVLMAFCHNSRQMPNWVKSGLLFSR
jgi:hypothetical protein